MQHVVMYDWHAAFAALINYLDMQVGEIIGKLKELGIYVIPNSF